MRRHNYWRQSATVQELYGQRSANLHDDVGNAFKNQKHIRAFFNKNGIVCTGYYANVIDCHFLGKKKLNKADVRHMNPWKYCSGDCPPPLEKIWKLSLTPTPDPNRPTRWVFWKLALNRTPGPIRVYGVFSARISHMGISAYTMPHCVLK